MLRNLGRFVWSQSRDIQVYNYPKVILYEIRTSDGNMWLKFCKKTEAWTLGKQMRGDVAEILKNPLQEFSTQTPLPSRTPRDIEFSPH
jgi:hypothetical protein